MSDYEPADEEKKFIKQAKRSWEEREAIPEDQKREMPRADRFDGRPLGSDAEENVPSERSE